MKLVALLLLFFLFPLKVQALDVDVQEKLFPDEITENMKYITVTTETQLGNACFITATGVGYALNNGYAFAIDPNFKKKYPLVFHRFPEYSIEKPKKEVNHWALGKDVLSFSKINQSTLITGCPNSDFWFIQHKDVIVEMLGPTEEMKEFLHQKYSEYFRKDKNYVGLHLRTFVQKGEDKVFYPISFFKEWGIYPEFYEKAMSLFPKDSVFVVFSDNIELAKKLLQPLGKRFVFQNNSDMYEDFYLMSMMERMIIPNSTFSAFSCFLNTNLKKVVVKPINTPCAHIIEPNWILLKFKYSSSGMRQWYHICKDEYIKLGFDK